ncbi:MAG: aldehyde dehydrogenase family protein, partial [Propionibacteriaceae bacterium]|nr:aldehyde dehydrogenase family protein [Propionibacteriaceae bacterium]
MAITQAALLESIPTGLFINGKWEKTAETFVVEDPATGEKLVDCSSAGPDDGRRALDAAVAAQEGWAKTAPRVRGEILRRAWEIVQDRREELSLLMTIEMGKPLNEASGEVTYGGEFLRWFAEEAVRINGRYGWNPEGTGHMLVSKHPVGPCLFISPGNVPFAKATRKVGPALAAA